MGLLTARTVLVLAAAVLVLVGIVLPGVLPTMPPWSRIVLVTAGLVCAVLDRGIVHGAGTDSTPATMRSSRATSAAHRSVVPTAPPTAAEASSAATTTGARPAATSPEASSPATTPGARPAATTPGSQPAATLPALPPAPEPPGPPTSTAPAHSGPEPFPAITLGTADDAAAGTVVTRGEHLVVVGHGPLAEAVFAAIVDQVVATVTAADVRHAPDDGFPLPDDAEVAVCWTADGRRRTVVRVPDQSTVPRLHDAVVEVGRYGCGVCLGGVDGSSAEMTRVVPVLPVLPISATDAIDAARRDYPDSDVRRDDPDSAARRDDPDSTPSRSDPDERVTRMRRHVPASNGAAGWATSAATGLSAARPPPGPDRPGRRHRAPAHRSPS
ncbi:hypothetical protein Csp2054_09700 [Curtobacterium sp. 'Ferrero']|uniref:hypothetical protein n=1 Tax=Curtobacterium sp. 'Ferrero' TaxID=2033654 RepID=UPI000BC57754|nr:hypothetical protein [Curtobacterium sp. 'Ferrero']PCN47877.1 hypothetical protein Csp2054_09700 [Curtobacterium sp. 'Ferrero']